jgi:hypothetical protein
MAWRLWAWFVLFFISGILFVNMLLAAARHRSSPDLRARWHLGRGHLVYHALLVVIIGALTIRMSAGASFLFVLAWIPMFLRAIKAWITFSHRPPSLKRVGMGELLYALWFTAFLSAWLRVG